jgi:hypothetical protein
MRVEHLVEEITAGDAEPADRRAERRRYRITPTGRATAQAVQAGRGRDEGCSPATAGELPRCVIIWGYAVGGLGGRHE